LIIGIRNVDMPAALAFRPVESSELNNDLFTTFAEHCGIGAGHFAVPLDESSAPKAQCIQHGIAPHGLCLRRLLMALTHGPFKDQTGNLVRCTAARDCISVTLK
jgi:hypothetical protein